jgi:hypothetical protein
MFMDDLFGNGLTGHARKVSVVISDQCLSVIVGIRCQIFFISR